MKKQMWKAIIILLVVALTAGCGSASEEKLYDYDLSEYVELGQYKGLVVPEFDTEVTEKEVRLELLDILESAGEYDELTEGVIEQWDIANIDYSGSKDGIPFEGGTGEGYDLTMGSGEFVPGFEDGLMGKQIGAVTIVDLTFPDNYSPELAGQAVEFAVKVNSVKRTRLSLEFVEANSEYNTIEDYIESIRVELKNIKEANQGTRERYLMEAVVDNCNIIDYPEKEIKAFIDENDKYFRDSAKQNGVTWKDFLSERVGMDQAAYDSWLLEEAQMQIGFEMILCAIAREENLFSEEDYEKGKLAYLNEMGYNSEQEYTKDKGSSFEEAAGKKNIEMSIIYEKVMEFIDQNAA